MAGRGLFRHPPQPQQRRPRYTPSTVGPVTLDFADAASTSDALGRAGTYGRALADALTSSDALSRTGTYLRALVDSVALSDALTRAATFTRGLADSVTTSDVWARILTLERGLADAVTTSDALGRVGTFARGIADSITTSEALTFVSVKVLAFADAVTTSDALEGFRAHHDAKREHDHDRALIASVTRLIDALVADRQRSQSAPFTVTNDDLKAATNDDAQTWTPQNLRLARGYLRTLCRLRRRVGRIARRIIYFPADDIDDAALRSVVMRRLLPVARFRLSCLVFTSDDEKDACLNSLHAFIKTSLPNQA